MTEHLESEIKRLLDETERAPQAGEPSSNKPSSSVRARLTADISEALATGRTGSGASDDLAAKSAFLDGGLPASERDAFAAALASDENLRADMESARALVETVSDAPAPVPAHLLRQVLAESLSAPAPVERGSIWSWLRASPSRPRLLWAAAAVAAMLVIVPALLTADHLGWWPWSENEPLSADHPDIEPPKACPDAAAQAPLSVAQQQAEKEQREKREAERQAAGETEPQAADATPDAPCPPPPDGVDQPPKTPVPATPANP